MNNRDFARKGNDMAKSKNSDIVVLTYSHVDGACAAAMVLLKYPGAEVLTTSAMRIGDYLARIAGSRKKYRQVHVCGLGVYCPWDKVENPARVIRRKGASITWYCGRGYLDQDLPRFKTICTPAFYQGKTNTDAVARHLKPGDPRTAQSLRALAGFDDRLLESSKNPTKEQAAQLALIEAAIAQYLKYDDRTTYNQTITKLAAGRLDESDRRMIAVHMRHGYRFMLHSRSRMMRDLKQRIRKFAEVDRPVIITGESGVGKEHVAHLLYERSGKRSTGPFIAVNCAVFAGNEALANSELFGHKKGAFSGATSEREGAFRAADGGVLYLDELGDLPLVVQAKLLRVLEDGLVTPVGYDKPMPENGVDVRIIAATNRDLPRMIRTREFRADLFHRLATLRIHVPPLREHPDDIRAITGQVLERLEAEGHSREITRDEMEGLRDYAWPGNVRQLIKVVERAVYLDTSVSEVLAEERALGDLLPRDEERTGESGKLLFPAAPDEIRSIDEIKQVYARHALILMRGNKTATAEKLGVRRNTLKAYLNGSHE